MIRTFELLAFAVSAAAAGYGAYHLFRAGIPKYFRLYACAAGCYMLEELWVIVNSFLGNGAEDGLVTVRLFGFFGCLCFMLSANANEFDKVVDDGMDRGARLLSVTAPLVLLFLYSLYAFSPVNIQRPLTNAVGLLSISPALPGAYYSLKHLLLEEDAMGFLDAVEGIDIIALVFYGANYIYPAASLYLAGTVMSVFDLTLGITLLVLMIMCVKGAAEWKTLI